VPSPGGCSRSIGRRRRQQDPLPDANEIRIVDPIPAREIAIVDAVSPCDPIQRLARLHDMHASRIVDDGPRGAGASGGGQHQGDGRRSHRDPEIATATAMPATVSHRIVSIWRSRCRSTAAPPQITRPATRKKRAPRPTKEATTNNGKKYLSAPAAIVKI